MKVKLIFFVIGGLILSCQNKNVDVRVDWIKKIDNIIKEYERTEKAEITKTLVDKGEESILTIYEKNSDGFQKIKCIYKKESIDVDFIQEIYLKNDEIILDKWSGLFPLLYKGKKEETDPCCELFERFIYYKNSSDGKVYVKALKLFNAKDREKFKEDLDILALQEEEGFNFESQYAIGIEQLKEIKNKLK